MLVHRVLVHAGAALFLTWMSGCGARPSGGAGCQAIALTDDPAKLPLGARTPVEAIQLRQSEPLITGTGELGCCFAHSTFSERADCTAVDCEALRMRLTAAPVLGQYVNEPCGLPERVFEQPPGVGRCTVFLEGETIVGVRAVCLD